jgi:hypothetical protein
MRLCRASFHILLALNVALAFAVPARAAEWSFDGVERVIVGDIVDRGADSRVAMDLLMRLEDEANSAGGKNESVR